MPTAFADDARRWETIHPERTVLAVARTFTSAIRLLDVLSIFRADFRVETLFTVDSTSAFSRGAAETLHEAGARVLPWAEASGRDADLMLTASENVDMERINAPIIVLPHGIGFHRIVPDSEGPGTRLSGLVPPERMRDKRLWMVLSHPAQREQLKASYPEAASRCLVAGDLTYDRMVASLPLRDDYRAALGIGAGQRLIVVTSTWGEESLFGRWRDLPARLLAELPADEYRVALVLHPNIWSWYGAHQVQRMWLDDAMDAGLLLIPPAVGWQAALTAADLVVGDQGSVTLYAAALDRPVLLAAMGETVVPGAPPRRLAAVAAALDTARSLREQVEAGIEGYRSGMFGGLTAEMFSSVSDSARSLRALFYDRLGLSPPAGRPLTRALPPPVPTVRPTGSHVVYSSADATERSVEMWRFPAAVWRPGTRARDLLGSGGPVSRPDTQSGPAAGAYRHVCADYADPDRDLPANASVVVRHAVSGAGDAGEWITSALGRYPGALMAGAAVPGGCVAGLRDGRRFLIAAEPTSGSEPTRTPAPGDVDPGLAMSALYTCVRAGWPMSGPVAVRAGRVGLRLGVSALG